MDLAHLFVFFVYAADFTGDNEINIIRDITVMKPFRFPEPERILEPEKSVLNRFKLFLQFTAPARMRAVAGSNDVYALNSCPVFQMFRYKVLARGHGEMRMNMKVGDKFH